MPRRTPRPAATPDAQEVLDKEDLQLAITKWEEQYDRMSELSERLAEWRSEGRELERKFEQAAMNVALLYRAVKRLRGDPVV